MIRGRLDNTVFRALIHQLQLIDICAHTLFSVSAIDQSHAVSYGYGRSARQKENPGKPETAKERMRFIQPVAEFLLSTRTRIKI